MTHDKRKPKVIYRNGYKHTLLATIIRPEARALLANKERGGDLYWHPVSNSKLEIYEDELLPDKPKKKTKKLF